MMMVSHIFKKLTGALFNRKTVLVLGLLVVLFLPNLASAQDAGSSFSGCSWRKVSTWPVCLIEGTANVLIELIGWATIFVAYIIEVILRASSGVLSLPMVQIGFTISLSVVNLGFVLAIIIIAIATIFRYQTYNIKQLLWRLIVAVLLVNFSFVFAGAILGFADSFMGFFPQLHL